MNIYKGTIITCDKNDLVCQYLVEKNGRIAYAGNELPEKYSKEKITTLGEKALIPSFSDSHLHFSSYSLISSTLDVRGAKDFASLSDILSNYVQKANPKVVLGFGISAHSLVEQRMITRPELDKMEKRPVMLIKYDGHASVINTAMKDLLPSKIKKLRGYNGDAGQLFQEAFFAATDYITSKVSVIALMKHMLSAVDTMAAKGISLVHPAEGVGFVLDLDVDLVRLLARGLSNPFQFRIFFQTMETKKVLKRKLPRIGGCFATALDGCFGSCDAALLQPYEKSPENKGILFYTDRQVNEFVQNAHDKGLQIQLHAIGDAAVNQATQAFDRALKNNFRKDHRHSIIHASLMGQESLDLCAAHEIGIAAQPALLNLDLEPYDYLEKILGQRVNKISPFRRMLDMGIHVSGGSDAPVTLPDPAFGMHCACNHYESSQSVSIMEALKMFTRETAWASFDETDRGSLEPGKIADMAILDQNPLDMDKKDLFRLKADTLFLGGKKYEPGQGLARLLWNALFPKR
ncbi:MAG: amidohydrolase family protein [Desulfobacteraceae bacterium]|nr:amidohydrolase family protein [Desulfobacteraceae bacterium]